MSTTSQNIASQQSNKQDEWFDEMINSLKVDQVQIKLGRLQRKKNGFIIVNRWGTKRNYF
ncbi:MAG: hypothetical protein ACQETL_13630 [Bacteroidota bacterium]